MLHLSDLERALEDDRHLGFGFGEIRYVEGPVNHLARVHVIREANRLGLDYEGLFLWVNSKAGRWLCDDLQGASAHEVPARVKAYLNETEMNRLRFEAAH